MRNYVGKSFRLLVLSSLLAASTGWIGAVSSAASAPAAKTGESLPAALNLKRAAALGSLIPGAGAHRPLTGASCAPLFSLVGTPDASTKNFLTTAAAVSPTDIWAVGGANAGNGAVDRNLAEHWNGSNWTIVSTPSYGTGFNDLNGVAANDSNDVWAVGSSQNGVVSYTLALHWNGSSWAGVATPQPSASNQFLSGVWALGSKNVWAAGGYLNGSGLFQNLVIHWDGSTWSSTLPPNAGAGDNLLQTLYARAADDIWAVGQFRTLAGTGSPTSNPWHTLIEHYDGSTWTIQTSINPVTGDNVLYNVSAISASDVWAIGYTDTGTLQQTLTEHLVAGVWTTVASPNLPTGDNVLFALVTLSPTNVWTAGFGKASAIVGGSTLVEHWNGSAWAIQTADSPGVNGNNLNGLAALPGNEVWGVGQSFSSTTTSTMAQHFQLPAPTNVTASPGDNTATVTWTAPTCDGGFTITGYQIKAWDGCTVQNAVPAGPTSPFTLPTGSVTNGSPYTFTVQAVSASLGAETPSAPSAVVVPTGATASTAFSACSRKQYQYVSPDPANFVDMDSTNLKLVVTPAVDSVAVISGNADLWTANAGLNQDIGLNVSGGIFAAGQVVGWKESGGFAGTFSPNAAEVQSAVTLAGSTPYTIKLQWKSNKAFPGAAIFAGAGPLPGGGGFISPTRLTVHLVPVSAATVKTVFTNKQYQLTGSNGTAWTDLDATLLTTPVTAAVDSMAVITGNADLWTANAGYNQDIALTVDGTLAAWKESGGFAGTFSPNAAYVQAFVPFTMASGPHTIKLQWKTNKPAAGATIFAGAGPLPATTSYSPTRLTIMLLPSVAVTPTVSNLQYTLPSSDGAGWTPIDGTVLQHTFVAPGSTFDTYAFAGNVDLFTANAGYNQDVGIFVSGGQYGSGTLVAWKESGGFAGTFSPNAAYVEAVQHLVGGTTYTFWLAWKTNKQAAGATIYAGAGPLPATTSYSPTSLTAFELSSP